MDGSTRKASITRKKRAMRVRKKLKGTASRPRMSVIKSNKHIAVQVIDDNLRVTLASTSTFAKEFRTTEFNKKGLESAKALGKYIAEKVKDLNIEAVVFDKGSSKYHGVLAVLADAARAEGLKF